VEALLLATGMPNEATPLKGPAAATEDVSFFGTASWARYGKVPGLISTMVLLCLGAVLDNADDTTLAGMLRAFEEVFGVSAYDESGLLLGAGLGMALASPFWGLLADAHTRLYLISAGAAAWGLFTLLSAFATSFTWLIVTRTLTGVALAGILPIGQSLVADMFDADMRGRAFSVVQLVGSLGSFLGLATSTNVSELALFGQKASGWRGVFFTLAILSLVYAAIVPLAGTEPPRLYARARLTPAASCQTLRYMASVPTLLLITLQGIFGHIPWNAISGFGTIWLQSVGLSNLDASLLIVMMSIGQGLGYVIAGFLGDWAARKLPDTGRVWVACCSVGGSIFFAILIFLLIPADPSSAVGYGFAFGLFGLVASWCKTGVNQPMLSEVVPPHVRATVMATEFGIEAASAAIFGAPLVGIIAESAFGYTSSNVSIADTPPLQQQQNADALRGALALMTIVPWSLCFVCYITVSFTFARDRDRAAAIAAATAAPASAALPPSTAPLVSST